MFPLETSRGEGDKGKMGTKEFVRMDKAEEWQGEGEGDRANPGRAVETWLSRSEQDT